MSDLARRIREARDALGISIEDAERATRIRRRFIEAIEAGDFTRLPDGPPSRGFVRNYARYLGLDADQSLTDFEAEVGVPISQISEEVPPPPTRQQKVSQYTQLVKLPQVRWKGEMPADEQVDVDVMADTAEGPPDGSHANGNGRTVFRRSVQPAQSSSFSLRVPTVSRTSDVRPFSLGHSAFNLRNSNASNATAAPNRIPSLTATSNTNLLRTLMMLGAAVLGLAVVVGLVALVILPALRGDGQEQAAAPVATQGITVSILGSTPVPGAVSTETAQSAVVPVTPTVNTATPAVQPAPGGGVVLTLDALERAWVRVRADGNVIYTGIPPIGPNSTWRGQNTIGIETGNAGAFDVIINNVRMGTPGARNVTINVTWDANGKVVGN